MFSSTLHWIFFIGVLKNGEKLIFFLFKKIEKIFLSKNFISEMGVEPCYIVVQRPTASPLHHRGIMSLNSKYNQKENP